MPLTQDAWRTADLYVNMLWDNGNIRVFTMSGWFLFAPRAAERSEAKTLSSQRKYDALPPANKRGYDRGAENELAVLELSVHAATGCEAGQLSHIAAFDDIERTAVGIGRLGETAAESARMCIIAEALCEYGTTTTRAWNHLGITATDMGNVMSRRTWFGIQFGHELPPAVCPLDSRHDDSPFARKLCEWNEQAGLIDSDSPMLMASSPSDDPIEVASLPTHAQLLTVARAGSITWESIGTAPPGSPATYGPLYLLSQSTLTAVRRASFSLATETVLPCTAYENSVEMDVDTWLRSHSRATQAWARALAVSLGRFGIDAMGNSETNAHTGSADAPSAFSFAWSASFGTAGASHPWLADGVCEQLLCTVMSLERLYISTEPVDSMHPPLVQLVQLMYENALVHFMRHAVGMDSNVPSELFDHIESTSMPIFARSLERDPSRQATLEPMCAALQLITAWAGILFHASDHMTDNACRAKPWEVVAMAPHADSHATWIAAPMTAPPHSMHSRAWELASTVDYYHTIAPASLHHDVQCTVILAESATTFLSGSKAPVRCTVCGKVVDDDALKGFHKHLHARKCITAIARAARATMRTCKRKAHVEPTELDAPPGTDANDDDKSSGSTHDADLRDIREVLYEAERQVIALFGCECLGVQVSGHKERTIRTNATHGTAIGMLNGWISPLPMPHFAARC